MIYIYFTAVSVVMAWCFHDFVKHRKASDALLFVLNCMAGYSAARGVFTFSRDSWLDIAIIGLCVFVLIITIVGLVFDLLIKEKEP